MTLPKLGTLVHKLRSKNAGPFWLTIDIFCGDAKTYRRVIDGLKTELVAQIYDTEPQTIKRFDIADLNVIKFSFPRPTIQGAVADRDMHGASWAALLSEAEIDGAHKVR
ncbi:MAG: DUF4387 family protein [Paracoccaceae bacterium]